MINDRIPPPPLKLEKSIKSEVFEALPSENQEILPAENAVEVFKPIINSAVVSEPTQRTFNVIKMEKTENANSEIQTVV